MPAIQPSILKQQAALLAEHFDDPPAYIRSLHYLLDYYADRSRHPGTSGKPSPIISAYKVHPPILRALLQELIPAAAESPDQALELCDALWIVPFLEFKLLAVMLLGQIPMTSTEPLIARLKDWLAPDLEYLLIQVIMENTLEKLNELDPRAMERILEGWLEHEAYFYKQLGLRALLPLIHKPNSENLPMFFRLIQPLTCEVPSGLRPDLLDIIAALAERSPVETAYFLRQTLRLPESRDTPWLIRHSFTYFPDDIQSQMREFLRSAPKRE